MFVYLYMYLCIRTVLENQSQSGVTTAIINFNQSISFRFFMVMFVFLQTSRLRPKIDLVATVFFAFHAVLT